jgi:hypothetical protein
MNGDNELVIFRISDIDSPAYGKVAFPASSRPYRHPDVSVSLREGSLALLHLLIALRCLAKKPRQAH